MSDNHPANTTGPEGSATAQAAASPQHAAPTPPSAAHPVGHPPGAQPVAEASGTRGARPYLLLALGVIVLDQITKYLVIGHFGYAERMPVIAGFFDLTLVYNPGAAFSFLADHGGWQRWFFTVFAAIVSGVLVWMLVRHDGSTVFRTAIGLVLGGAVGNLLDRVLLGHVTDFLLFYQGTWSFPAFNLADCAITVGAVLWILDELIPGLRASKRAS